MQRIEKYNFEDHREESSRLETNIYKFIVGRNCRVFFYVHKPTGVRDGRFATLLLQLIFPILLVMGNNIHNVISYTSS